MTDLNQVYPCAASAALSAKRGEVRVQDLKGASRDLFEHLSEGELAEMAGLHMPLTSAQNGLRARG